MTNSSLESAPKNSPSLWVAPLETVAAGGKQLKSELESRDPLTMSYEELKAMYDDISKPFGAITPELTYKNKAKLKQEELDAEHKRQNRGHERFDELVPHPDPSNTGLMGGIHPTPITDKNRPRFLELCTVALGKYNAENQIVRTNSSTVEGIMHYITFEARDATDGATQTFQAKVWEHLGQSNKEPVVVMCQMKPN